MKNHFTFLLSILLLILNSCNHKGKEFKIEKITVKEGFGFNEIVLMKTRKSEIIKLFGDKFEQTNHNGSIEINYKNQGISFYYDSSDIDRIIDFISFKNNFHGKTSKGFDIQSMDLNDVLKIYGNPFWRFSEESDEIKACYDDLGIEFCINKKVKINDSIPTSYFLNDIYVNRMLLRYFSSVYGADKIKEFVISVRNKYAKERPFIGKSEIDSVFRINISKHPVGLLNNRIMAYIPVGVKVPKDGSSIYYKKNQQSFTFSLDDWNCSASGDMKKDIEKIIKSWSKNGNSYNLKEVINKKNISIYIIEPLKIKTNDNYNFILKCAFIKNADNTILFAKSSINSNALYNLKNFQRLSDEMIKRIQPGSKKLNLKSEIVELKSNERKIIIKKPAGFIFTLDNGPDFRVYRIVKSVRFDEASPGLLIYIGNHPNFVYNHDNTNAVTVKKSGRLFGQKVEWNFCYKDKNHNPPYTLEGICKFNEINYVHCALSVISKADLELFKKSLPETDF